MSNQRVASEIISYFHEYAIWLPRLSTYLDVKDNAYNAKRTNTVLVHNDSRRLFIVAWPIREISKRFISPGA